MPDMLVKLYDLPDEAPALARSHAFGVEIRRAMAPDRQRVLDWVRTTLATALPVNALSVLPIRPLAAGSPPAAARSWVTPVTMPPRRTFSVPPVYWTVSRATVWALPCCCAV